MFHIFNNKEERKTFGGSAFVELQYCRLNLNSKLKKIGSLRHIKHWQDDSLYIFIDDIDDFIKSYGDIFNDGDTIKSMLGQLIFMVLSITILNK